MYTVLAVVERKPMIPIWQEVVVGAVAFGILCFVLMKYVFPRMEQTFDARIEAIEGGVRRAEATRAEAEQLLDRYRAELAEARTDAARIRNEARAEVESIRQTVLAEARQESDRTMAAGREQLAADRRTTVRELRTEIGSLAVDLAGRIVGESVADEAHRRGSVGRFLADLESTGSR
ncbi:F0F1 ATP synthase subunit B [Micromonospora sp. NPDC004704]